MPEISDNVVAIAVFGFIFLVPVIGILSKHQLKMTALLRGQQTNPNEQLLGEMQELRNLVIQQSMAIDSLRNSQYQLAEELKNARSLENRLNV